MRLHPWTILCDFDGTISQHDVTDALLQQLARPGWEEVEDQWKDGAIGSRECMSRQIAMIEAGQADLDRVIDSIGLDPEFGRFVALAAALDAPLEILSDGLDHAIQRLLSMQRLDWLPVSANTLEHAPPSAWRIAFPHADDGCASGNCKCTCARRQRRSAQRLLLIGDGQSDACVAGCVDFVFAKSSLLAHCRRHGIAHRPISGFADAITLLPRLLAGDFDARSSESATSPSQAPLRAYAT